MRIFKIAAVTTLLTTMPQRTPLFPPWSPTNWTPQNDSIRGGSSTSSLTVSSTGKTATFSGTLNSKTLGGAGFASVTTTGIKSWDWREYTGLELQIKGEDKKKKTYTLILKNHIPNNGTPNNETSTISFEYNFSPAAGQGEEETLIAPFSGFVPYYRGKRVDPPPVLDLACVKRMSFMVRSFFGEERQEGEFKLGIMEVVAARGGKGGGGVGRWGGRCGVM